MGALLEPVPAAGPDISGPYRDKRKFAISFLIMKNKAFLNNFISAFLALCLTGSGLMCLVTAFDLPVSRTVLLSVPALVGLATALLLKLRRGWIPLLGLWIFALLFLLFFCRKELLTGVYVLITNLGSVYSRAYSLYVPELPVSHTDTCTLVLTLWGSLVCWLGVWTLERRQSLLPSLLFACLPLGLCLVVVDTPPGMGWLLLLLFTVVLLLLSQSSRRLSEGDGLRLTGLLMLPVLLLLLGLNLLLPREHYSRDGFGQNVLNFLVEASARVFPVDVNEMGALDFRVPVARVESLEIGPRWDTDQTVMTVNGPEDGAVYLRGMTYAIYTGSSWEMLQEEVYGDLDASQGLVVRSTEGSVSSLSVRARSQESVLYTPYYMEQLPEAGSPMLDACIENTDGLRNYAITYYHDVESYWFQDPDTGVYLPYTGTEDVAGPILRVHDDYPSVRFGEATSPYGIFVQDYYTRLPDSTRAALLELAREAGLDETSTPEEVAAFVRDSAVYDLKTRRMPEGADFALWFLESSDTGYCVHFASAATVMLRALGIPARYVTGYLATCEADRWSTVTEKNAHAWCEYYSTDWGWIPLEATPPDGVASTADPDSTNPVPDDTEPEETTKPEDSDRPATEPQELTAPTKPPKPGSNANAQTVSQAEGSLPGYFRWILGICGLVGLFLLRRPLVLYLRRRSKPAKVHPKRRFLQRWRADCRLAQWLGAPVCLEHLAERAYFSRHNPTAQDLEQLKAWEEALQNALNRAPWYRRFFLRWILILI